MPIVDLDSLLDELSVHDQCLDLKPGAVFQLKTDARGFRFDPFTGMFEFYGTIGVDFAKGVDCHADLWIDTTKDTMVYAALRADYEGAQISDHAGINAWHDAERAQEVMQAIEQPIEAPKPCSRAKPALAGLGVTAPEDHRLGRWKALP